MQSWQRNLYVLCLSIFLASVSWFQVMPFLPLFLQDLGVPKADTLRWSGIIFSVQSLASIVMLPFWGRLGDRFGQKVITVRAGLCLAGIYFGMSVCHTPVQLAILRFLNGGLTGFIPGSIALIAKGTPTDRGPRAVATAQTASAVGQILGPGIGGAMAHLFGYRGTLSLSGWAVLLSTALVVLLVREGARSPAARAEKSSMIDDFRLAFRSPVLASVMLIVLVNGFFVASVNPILAIHLRNLSRHAPDWYTGMVFSLPAAAFVLSAQMWTRYGERRGYDQAIRIGFAGAAVFAVMLAGVRSIWLFAPAYFLLGLCQAAVNPSTGAVICTRVPEHFRGRAYSMQLSAVMLGALLAPMASTQTAARFGVPVVFLGAGVLFLLGRAGFLSLARRWDKAGGIGEVSG